MAVCARWACSISAKATSDRKEKTAVTGTFCNVLQQTAEGKMTAKLNLMQLCLKKLFKMTLDFVFIVFSAR